MGPAQATCACNPCTQPAHATRAWRLGSNEEGQIAKNAAGNMNNCEVSTRFGFKSKVTQNKTPQTPENTSFVDQNLSNDTQPSVLRV